MWIVVLIAMLVPVKISVPIQSSAEFIHNETLVVQEDTEWMHIDETEGGTTVPPQFGEVESTRQRQPLPIINLTLLAYVWMVGVILFATFKLASYFVFLAKIRVNSQSMDCPELKKYTKRRVIVRASDIIYAPLMVGVLKPILLLPKTELTPEQLHHILAHETTHLKRQDILYKWFVSAVKCIHWFNPAVYFIGKQINLDCEVSCDATVVKELSETGIRDYAETILSLLSLKSVKTMPLTTGMTGSKATLKKRFTMMKQRIQISRKMKVLSIILAVFVVAGTVFASGMLHGYISSSNRTMIEVQTDKRQDEEFNFLMLGVDENDRVDTILVFHFDGKMLTGMIIPRNVSIFMPEENIESGQRLSDLLAKENGDQRVIDAIRTLLGIPVQYYARVNIDAIEDIVDSVGGMEFDIPNAMHYDDPAKDLHIHLSAGNQMLTGRQVGHLLRYRDRNHPNGDELRMMQWETVIREFINQAILGNKIKNATQLYKIATRNIKTNYSGKFLVKDFKALKEIDRNHIVLEKIPGRNVVVDGYFVYHINMVEADPLLRVFQANDSNTKLVSVITYQNESMGFQIQMPERWKSKYEVVQFDNQVVFFHKGIFLKYGKGLGKLFSITKVTRDETDKMEERPEPYKNLYWTKDWAYIWSVASDVQFPIWTDRDEEDKILAEDYEIMMGDLEFIRNSFALIE